VFRLCCAMRTNEGHDSPLHQTRLPAHHVCINKTQFVHKLQLFKLVLVTAFVRAVKATAVLQCECNEKTGASVLLARSSTASERLAG
jgi:hypothetical protein